MSVIFLCALGLVLLLLVPYGWVPGSLLVIFAGVIVVVLVLDRDRLSFKGGPLEGVYEARSTTKVATEVIPDIESPEDAGDHSTRVLGARDRSDLETLTAPQELAEPPTLRPLTAAPQPHLAHSVDAVSAAPQHTAESRLGDLARSTDDSLRVARARDDGHDLGAVPVEAVPRRRA